MNVITAKEAREIANQYVPYEIKSTLEYVMEDIEKTVKYGGTQIEFCDILTPYAYLETIKSNEFKKYIESLGYKYEFNSKKTWDFYSEWVTISW